MLVRSRNSRLASHKFQSVNLSSRHFSNTKFTMAAKLDINSKLRMNSGYDIPLLGYADMAEEVTDYAIRAGFRHVDSAVGYRNEKGSAAGMLKAKIPRDQLFFTTKVPAGSINYDDAKRHVEESLKETGLDYIDLYLLHAPYGGREGRLGGWKALVEKVNEGKIRSIGVSNYGVHHLEELEQWQKEQPKEQAGILSVNQIELHPWVPRAEIQEWCEKRGVVLEAYSPLVQATRMDDPLLKPLATKYNKTPAQILLRWGLQKNFVILPKSVTKKRIDENTGLYDFELSKEDMDSLRNDEYSPVCWDPAKEPLSK